MKGIVFNEFLEMVEDKFGEEMVELIIEDVQPDSEAAYTSIGTYDHKEIVQFVTALSLRSKIDTSLLIQTFGKYLFHSFLKRHKDLLEKYTNGFDLLKDIQDHIHVQVEKIYANTELPDFQTSLESEKSLKMVYSSKRKLSDLAEGLIMETMDHFNHSYTINKTVINKDGSLVEFLIVME